MLKQQRLQRVSAHGCNVPHSSHAARNAEISPCACCRVPLALTSQRTVAQALANADKALTDGADEFLQLLNVASLTQQAMTQS